MTEYTTQWVFSFEAFEPRFRRMSGIAQALTTRAWTPPWLLLPFSGLLCRTQFSACRGPNIPAYHTRLSASRMFPRVTSKESLGGVAVLLVPEKCSIPTVSYKYNNAVNRTTFAVQSYFIVNLIPSVGPTGYHGASKLNPSLARHARNCRKIVSCFKFACRTVRRISNSLDRTQLKYSDRIPMEIQQSVDPYSTNGLFLDSDPERFLSFQLDSRSRAPTYVSDVFVNVN